MTDDRDRSPITDDRRDFTKDAKREDTEDRDFHIIQVYLSLYISTTTDTEELLRAQL